MKHIIGIILVLFILSGCSYTAIDGTSMVTMSQEQLQEQHEINYFTGLFDACVAAQAMIMRIQGVDPNTVAFQISMYCFEYATQAAEFKYPEPLSPTEELEEMGIEVGST